MTLSQKHPPLVPPDDNILTVQEAIEPLYQKLEDEVEHRLVAAAVGAGWSPYDALVAIDQLKRHDAAHLHDASDDA